MEKLFRTCGRSRNIYSIKDNLRYPMKMHLISVITALICASLVRAEHPNILWLFCDDMAVNGISAYDSRFSEMKITPNIDRIGDEGVRFERCYVSNSVCAPSRATLLSVC